MLDQVVSELLHDGVARSRLDSLRVNSHEDSHVGLHAADATSSLLSIDGAVISAQAHVASSGDVDTISLSRAGVGELAPKLLSLSSRDSESSAGCPGGSIMSQDRSGVHDPVPT